MSAVEILQGKIVKARRAVSVLQARLSTLATEIANAIRASDPGLSALRAERSKVQGELSDTRETVAMLEAGLADAAKADAKPAYEASLKELEMHAASYRSTLEKLPAAIQALEVYAQGLTTAGARVVASLNAARDLAEEAGGTWPRIEVPRIPNSLIEALNLAVNGIDQIGADRIVSLARAPSPASVPGRQTIADRMAERARA